MTSKYTLLGTENNNCGGVMCLLCINLYVSIKSIRCLLTKIQNIFFQYTIFHIFFEQNQLQRDLCVTMDSK